MSDFDKTASAVLFVAAGGVLALLVGWDLTLFVAIVVLLVLLVNGAYELGREDGFDEGASSAMFADRIGLLATEDRPAVRDKDA